ncbi:cytochrome P450 [Artomyces pyxidatus]|uniref:Cytochrome P450 n=1 Tax=Artomyces pyxidatus TaxID=48021 RepID=A0ACB8T6J7_9AGAM|nr:cytochrome P450 [Artomyces pyxidatus]
MRSYMLPTPPGPIRLPFIGSLLSIPKHTPWKDYAEWSRRENSDLVAIQAFGQLSIIVNTKKAVRELYDGRSSVYADRPQLMMNTLLGWDFATSLMPYSNEWRTQRKIFHQSLNSRAVPVHHQIQLEKVELLMKWIYDDPQEFSLHIRRYSASIAMLIAYDYNIEPHDDHFIKISEEAVNMISNTVSPVGIAVNAIPALRHLPDWFPGAGFKKDAKRCDALTAEMQDAPLEYVKRSMAEGTARPSVASAQIELNNAQAGGAAGEKELKRALGTFYAGTDGALTVSALRTGLLALVLHPDVQQRARAELDQVVGRDRLPTFEDQPFLPYITAICRETLRWQVVLPLSLAHSPTQDDVYAGMFIPKGAVIAMAILHNPEDYPDPESFKPERFLTTKGALNQDEVQVAFGLGRRNCVGMHLANSTIWIMMASLLATFDITKAKDEYGNEIPVDIAYTDSVLSTSLPYRCSFRPRDREAEELLRRIDRENHN